MWKKFTKKIKKEILEEGMSLIEHGEYTYPITRQLINDGKKNKVLFKKIKIPIDITMFHGSKDNSVPVSFSRKVLKIFVKSRKKLIIIKNGDHSLSSKKNLKRITEGLDKMVKNTFLN